MRLLYERQQQQHQDHLAEQLQIRETQPNGSLTKQRQQQQAGDDKHDHELHENRLGTDEARTLSRLLSPPREELNKVDIKELFTNVQVSR